MSSGRVLAGTFGFTTSIRSEAFTGAMPTKSDMSLKGLLGSSVSFTVCVFDITSSV